MGPKVHMIGATIIRCLEQRNPLIAPLARLSIQDEAVPSAEFANRAVKVASNTWHACIFWGVAFAEKRIIASVAYVWKNDVSVSQKFVFVEFFAELTKRDDMI